MLSNRRLGTGASGLAHSARQAVSQAMMLLRLAQDLPGFLRTPISVEQAEAILKHRLETRSERFLEMAQSTIYSHPRSPYLKLLRAAGCELSDLQRLVAVDGLEGALARLVGAGVYLTQDELKGQREVIRGSQRFMFADQDFDNPSPAPAFFPDHRRDAVCHNPEEKPGWESR